jgi:hypothetical protein
VEELLERSSSTPLQELLEQKIEKRPTEYREGIRRPLIFLLDRTFLEGSLRGTFF